MWDILGLIFVQWTNVKVQSAVAMRRYLKILMVKMMSIQFSFIYFFGTVKFSKQKTCIIKISSEKGSWLKRFGFVPTFSEW